MASPSLQVMASPTLRLSRVSFCCVQVFALACTLLQPLGLRVGLAAAQASVAEEARAVAGVLPGEGADVLVATPGRLVAHVQGTPNFSLRYVAGMLPQGLGLCCSGGASRPTWQHSRGRLRVWWALCRRQAGQAWHGLPLLRHQAASSAAAWARRKPGPSCHPSQSCPRSDVALMPGQFALCAHGPLSQHRCLFLSLTPPK
jgi:hypothetical protein